MENLKSIAAKYDFKLKKSKLIPGEYYRAVTFDGDIHDGILTYAYRGKAEMQIGNDFRSFNTSCTKLVKYAGE